jgi:hypothetical protein
VPTLADASIREQARLRELAARAVATAWDGLPGHDEQDVPAFLRLVLPVVFGAQVQSARLTDAYLARELGRRPVGVPAAQVAGQAVRAGAQPEDVYRRPFVTVWTALSEGRPFADAVAAGRAHAAQSARMDVQLANRATYQAVQEADQAIRGYRRVADADACAYCQMIDGAFVKSADAMPLHPGCGCGLEPVTDRVTQSPVPDAVAVREHGELGPVLTDPAHNFTSAADLAA